MPTTISGIVKDGLIVPSAPLPEGSRVEISVCEGPPELSVELDAWQRASAKSFDLVERLARKMDQDEKR